MNNNYSDDVRQPLLGAGRDEKTDGPAPPSYTVFSDTEAGPVDGANVPGEAFFSGSAGVPERAGFLSFLQPGRRGSHHHYYHYYHGAAPEQHRTRRHRRSCCRSLCMHLCCLTLLALLALYVAGVSLGLIRGGFRFWHPTLRPHDNNGDQALPPAAPGTPSGPVHTVPDHPAPPARVALPPPSPSAPLAGALFLPGRQCQVYNSGKTFPVIPSTAYDVQFGEDQQLAVRQNVTRWGPHDGLTTMFLDPLDADVAEAVVGSERRRTVQVYGDVVIRTGLRAAVEIEALGNDERIRAYASYDAERQAVAVTVDDGVWEPAAAAPGNPASDPWPCLVVRATVWVPPAAARPAPLAPAQELRALHVDAVHLGVVVADDVALAVRENIRLSSVVGDVDGHYDVAADKPSTKAVGASGFVFDAPKAALVSTSGHIHGLWSRRNRLVGSTVSGDIAITVRALPLASKVDDDEDDSAEEGLGNLIVDTVSGNIDLHEVEEAAPASHHGLVASSKSGSISGSASFARFARLHTVSGAITARLAAIRWPLNKLSPSPAPRGTAFLGTDSVTGATDLTVTAFHDDAAPLDFLRSHHRTVSGAVTLHYPSSWVGHIELINSFGGSVAVHGDNVQELPHGPHEPRFGHRLAAVKDVSGGNGNPQPASNVTVATVSAAIELSF